MLREVKGDLFSSEDSLAHCVSSCLEMGKGIAVEFKKRFGRVEELKKQNSIVPYLQVGDRYIFYLVTKEKYYGKPTYDTLYSSLLELKKLLLQLNITNLSIPKIGCGLDRLDWKKVKSILIEIFSNTNISITVYHL